MMISNSCSKMIQKMKRQSKLNNAALRQLLVPALEHLDLSGVYITDSTLKLVWKNCPNLRVLSLKDCGYIVTDSIMEQLVKVKWEGDFSNIKAKHSHRCQLSLHQKFCLGLFTYKGLFKVCKLCPSNTKQKFWYWINYIHYEPNKENYIFITKKKMIWIPYRFPFRNCLTLSHWVCVGVNIWPTDQPEPCLNTPRTSKNSISVGLRQSLRHQSSTLWQTVHSSCF